MHFRALADGTDGTIRGIDRRRGWSLGAGRALVEHGLQVIHVQVSGLLAVPEFVLRPPPASRCA